MRLWIKTGTSEPTQTYANDHTLAHGLELATPRYDGWPDGLLQTKMNQKLINICDPLGQTNERSPNADRNTKEEDWVQISDLQFPLVGAIPRKNAGQAFDC